MALEFAPVTTDEEIEHVASMADEIWHEYWPGMLSYAQVDYMVEKYQSAQAIATDIRENGYEYWSLVNDGRVVGYTGGHTETDSNKFFISKIYLYANERGKGFASEVVRFYEDLCLSRGLEAMYLTVNKYNDMGIRAYLAKGFVIVEPVVTSIGQGFVMDDYIMEKEVVKPS